MRNNSNKINISIDFNQVVDLIRQLPYEEKVKLGEVILKEIKTTAKDDYTLTHFASEEVLSRDWLSTKEDDAWENL
jgi:hypothetical protein